MSKSLMVTIFSSLLWLNLLLTVLVKEAVTLAASDHQYPPLILDGETDLHVSCIGGKCMQQTSEPSVAPNPGLMLPVRIARNQTFPCCYEALADIPEQGCGSSAEQTYTELGLLLYNDGGVKILKALLHDESLDEETDELALSTVAGTTNSTTTKKKCKCTLTLAGALQKLHQRLEEAQCPPVTTIVIVADPGSTTPTEPLTDLFTATPTSTQAPSTAPTPTKGTFIDKTMDAIKQQNNNTSVNDGPAIFVIDDPEEIEEVRDSIVKDGGPRIFKFDIDIIDETPKEAEPYEYECNIIGWIFAALIILSMILSLLATIALSCCWQIGFTISWCDLVISWGVSLLVALSFVLPKVIDPQLMLRLVAFVVDGLVLVSLLLRRVWLLLSFHTGCLMFTVGAMAISFIVATFGAFAFQLQLQALLVSIRAALPDWAITMKWLLRGIAITCISFMSALGIWCYHIARNLIVRPTGKHRPYKEVSLVCGVGALSMLMLLIHELLKDSVDLMSHMPTSLLSCVLMYLAHSLRCWLLLLLAVWQPGTGTHHVRARLPLPTPKAWFWQPVSKRQMEEMKREDLEHLERVRALEQGNTTTPREQITPDRPRGTSAGGVAAMLTGLAALFRPKKKSTDKTPSGQATSSKPSPSNRPASTIATPRRASSDVPEQNTRSTPPPPVRRTPPPPLQTPGALPIPETIPVPNTAASDVFTDVPMDTPIRVDPRPWSPPPRQQSLATPYGPSSRGVTARKQTDDTDEILPVNP